MAAIRVSDQNSSLPAAMMNHVARNAAVMIARIRTRVLHSAERVADKLGKPRPQEGVGEIEEFLAKAHGETDAAACRVCGSRLD